MQHSNNQASVGSSAGTGSGELTPERIAAQLAAEYGQNPATEGNGWKTHCPAHHDPGPSFSIAEGDQVPVLFHCHAGCDDQEVIAALRERGLWPERRLELPHSSIPAQRTKGEVVSRAVAYWTYRDAEGAVLGFVVRYRGMQAKGDGSVPKDDIPFFARKPNGNWRMRGYQKGETRPVYNQHLLAEYPGVGALVAEGEKSAEACAGLFPERIATTSQGGAGQGGKADWGLLCGRDVIVWPDKDRAGTNYAETVIHALLALENPPPRIRVVDVDAVEALGDKQDAADWVQSGKGAAEAAELPLLDYRQFLDFRPEIIVEGGRLPEEVDQAEEALKALPEPRVFRRGSQLVRVAVSDYGEPSIHEVGVSHLMEVFTRAARWSKWDGRSETYQDADCPERVAKAYLERTGAWSVPPLRGIVEAPTLRRDGTILDEPGYDPSSGLYFLSSQESVRRLNLPVEPDREDALQALDLLRSLIPDFPFVSPADESVALSGFLTPLIRRSLDTAPLHAFSAPAPGTGKSHLVDLASIIATGREASVVSQAQKEEETEKRLSASLMEGHQVVSVDNCDRQVQGELMCQILTQSSVSLRVLGYSRMIQTPTSVALFATGNNLRLAGDMTRRALLAMLDTGMERPEERQFNINPLHEATQRRPEFVRAGLTILRAYHLAGRPDNGLRPMGSFETWSNWVRGALVWLGMTDPVQSVERIREEDPAREFQVEVLQAWRAAFGPQPTTVGQAIEAARGLEYPQLSEALQAISGGSSPNSRRVGHWLRRHKDKPVKDMVLREAGEDRNKVKRWVVEALDGPGPVGEAPRENLVAGASAEKGEPASQPVGAEDASVSLSASEPLHSAPAEDAGDPEPGPEKGVSPSKGSLPRFPTKKDLDRIPGQDRRGLYPLASQVGSLTLQAVDREGQEDPVAAFPRIAHALDGQPAAVGDQARELFWQAIGKSRRVPPEVHQVMAEYLRGERSREEADDLSRRRGGMRSPESIRHEGDEDLRHAHAQVMVWLRWLMD